MGNAGIGFMFRTTVMVLTPVVPWAMTASAQTVASNFEQLRFKVRAGAAVYVTEETGQEHLAQPSIPAALRLPRGQDDQWRQCHDR